MSGNTISRWYESFVRPASLSVDTEEKVVEDLFDFDAEWDSEQLDLDFSGMTSSLLDPFE